MIVQPYHQASGSARALADALGCRLIRIRATRHTPREKYSVINWGSGRVLFDDKYYVNTPAAVNRASNKRQAFTAFDGYNVPVPDWTCQYDEARKWFDEGKVVIQRDLLRSRSGRGILVCDPAYPCSEGGEMPTRDGRLWTKYVKKKNEYRVHVCYGQVIDVVQKKRRRGVTADSTIRSHGRGWVFARQDIVVPDCVVDVAVRAVTALGLDFGAADVGWTEYNNTARVYEVNTAPGLEGTTIDRYVTALVEHYAS